MGSIKQYRIEKAKIECATRKIDQVLELLKQRYKNENINTLDGIKIEWPDGWVHVRGSNTEPVIRITAEAESQEAAERYIETIKGQISC